VHRRSLKLFLTACLICAGVFISLRSSSASPSFFADERGDFFESRIRPLLVTSCLDCHNEAAKGGLRLDSREAALKGGKRGPAILPGNPDESLLIKAIAYTHETLRMPRGADKLKDSEIADLKRWIKDGVVWPADAPKTAKSEYRIKPEHKAFWSFQPVANPAPPTVKGKTNNPIDAFLLAKLEANGLTYNPPADKRTLIRRATYDLTGLPPKPEEIAAFVADASPDAFARVVDRLLASPQYGERWARHWLDVARYSDTEGMADAGKNLQDWFPYAYTYRDWVIRAFNEDLPYDQFIKQQIAADRLEKNDPRNLAALGFLSLSRGGLGVNLHEKIDDKIDVVSRGLLGLTVSCARCHNHKFDPIPTKDYYSFYTIFNNSREPKRLPLLDPTSTASEKAEEELKAEQTKVDAEIAEMRKKRFPEIKTLYRTEPEVAKCLRSVYEAREIKADAEVDKFAREKDYQAYMLKRWRAYLGNAGESRVWPLWHALAAIPEKEFKEKAGAVIAGVAPEKTNPLVAQAFKETPATMREVADLYGKLLAANDKPEVQKEPAAEELRLVLRADDAPTDLPFADYEKYRLSTDKQLEDAKTKRLESLLLAQAYRGGSPRAQSLEDVDEPKPGHVFVRGKPENKGDEVKPEFLLILAGESRKPFTKGSGRLELAEAIADRNNPLTARVMVNRIWMDHFGAGLVRTPSDFGLRGEAPTHPELLDFLARSFMDSGWSIKKMHRAILLTGAYQQSSWDNPAARNADPENKWLWRMNRRRLDLEELRDTLLVASGKLSSEMGGLPVSAQAWPFTHRRTIYSFIDRALVPNDFRVFDFANPELHSAQRYLTTVPQQALMMMNSPFVMEQAKAMAERPEVVQEKTARRRIIKLYELALGRAPRAEEIAAGLQFVKDPSNSDAPTAADADEKCAAWKYGEGEYDEKADRVKSFEALDYFINGQWRNTPFPGDPRQTTAGLNGKGGSIGDNKTHSAIRRWTAGFDGRISITGVLEHNFENACRSCKGAFARVVSSRSGSAGNWTAMLSKTDTPVATLDVKRGDTIDFVVEGGKGTTGGEFKWTVSIKPRGQPETASEGWNSLKDFRRPSVGALNAWERYTQVLLASAEFIVLD
jgi:hypothetical protein